jgi:kynurenine--oxoglutarate transaminase/cysteine-S-conjugate beta-lyase/glutamine--phenylpyruvate transaminase
MWRRLPNRIEPYQYTVWTEFTPLAVQYKAVNLGQGFPGFPAPEFVKEALKKATDDDFNQYSRSQGLIDLVNIVAEVYKDKYDRTIEPLSEVIITMGASEGLLLAALGCLNPGDEAVMFDPHFDIYRPQIHMAGAVTKTVPLIPPEAGNTVWTIDFDAFRRAFNERTRVFLFNNPHNPVGKVFTKEEIQQIADILSEWPEVQVISDEVYEHLLFDGRKLHPIATFNDLWERSVTLSSAGKLFSVTGWKCGWGIGGKDIIRKMAISHQWVTYCSNTPCQKAVATALDLARRPYQEFPNYYDWINNEFIKKRDIVYNLLKNVAKKIKVDPIMPEGGYFMMARINASDIPQSYLEEGTPDFAFCRWMTKELGVTAIPCSAFFLGENKHLGELMVRFALCKDYVDYEKAAELLG